jgi:large subunit ribosomal protein L15
VHGKRGFENVFTVPFSVVNLGRIQEWVDRGRLPAGEGDWVTVKELADSRCVHGVKAGGVKLLADGELRSSINLVVARASEEAIRKVEERGGKVVTRYFGGKVGSGVRRVVRGEADGGEGTEAEGRDMLTATAGDQVVGEEKPSTTMEEVVARIGDEWKYRLPNPTSRKAVEYYRDERKRGYLSHTVPEGEGPSLFWKTPVKKGARMQRDRGERGAKGESKAERSENRLF